MGIDLCCQIHNRLREIMKSKRMLFRESGFTLIEILIVVIIVGLLAGLVGPELFGRLGKAKSTAARAQIEMLAAALDSYRLDMGSYPSTSEGLLVLIEQPQGDAPDWTGPYLKKSSIPADPWGERYRYRCPGEHGDFDLFTYGADKQSGGDGENRDIESWN